jgi:Undecaprenyl-phosphate glucose phosphotransferase
MNRRNQDILLTLRVLSDLGMVTLAWIGAYALRFSGALPIAKGVPEPALYWKLVPFIWIVWFGVFAGSGFYRRTSRHRSAFVEALEIIPTCVLATLAFIAFTYVYEEYRYSRIVMAIFAVTHPWLVIAGRSAIRKALRRYRRRAAPRRTLVIGGGDLLRHAIEMAKAGDLTRSEVQGVILAGDETQLASGREILARFGVPELQVPADWARFFTEHPTETVVFALPHKGYQFLDEHMYRIADQVPDIRLIPDLIRFTRFAAGVDLVGGTPVVTINETPLAGLGSVVKRLVDVVGALVGLALFGPLMIVIGLAVRLTSKGPAFYAQERMGLDGRTFRCLKFRSMRTDAEAKTGAVWASKGDDRTTPLGAFLRKTSLDELPQFLNVLRGEMSIVGPRPHAVAHNEYYARLVDEYLGRHRVKPGITGWAQVNGLRGETDTLEKMQRRVEYDLYYIDNWSLALDLKIILMTLRVGFRHQNAY